MTALMGSFVLRIVKPNQCRPPNRKIYVDRIGR